ncbi:prephenate dehydrogenase [Antarcticibacterium flavum]|uniref:Prephenate dehydrogenase n=1 Tax=Antarcticibacterium flavum TaxID=2058175 RepID=A0A5B7X2Q1_9FLAO|nr:MULTISPECIES: prephenate dehydrogenase [Antarcticibacterium]MCM4159893.1 prephenate dehydrogenase [Antarcticibacterium sp. W02-3]QCY68893.1 prephenate dehydrogenase [Antarcticibacterium flavum]
MKVHIIGTGLIGGSFALDIKEQFPEAEITGIDANESHLEEALEKGIIDATGTLEELSLADVVILAVPVDVSRNLLLKVMEMAGEDTLIFDAGSTKNGICTAVAGHPNRRKYLAAHPIAGTEYSGPGAAIKGLFRGKTNIICEVEKTAFKLQERALEIFQKLGMRIRYMDPAAHDKHIAYVSHLSHISSFMLGKTVLEKEKNEKDIFDLAGSGFASTVRLAKSSPAMWTPIFAQNKENVLETLDEYIKNLSNFRDLLKEEDYDGVFLEMEKTNHIKTILNGIN